MKRSTLRVLLLSVVLAAGLPAAASANLLVNGNFAEALGPGNDSGLSVALGPFVLYNAPNQGIPGWNLASGSVEVFTNYRDSGSRVVDMTGLHTAFGGRGPGTLEQSFATSAATSYNVSFLMGGTGLPTVKEMDVKITGSSGVIYQSVFAFDTGSVPQVGDLVAKQFSFTGDGPSASISFRSLINSTYDGPYLGNVAVTPVPEPGAYALFIAGLALFASRGVLARTRRVSGATFPDGRS